MKTTSFTAERIVLTGSSQNEGPVQCYFKKTPVLLHFTMSEGDFVSPEFVEENPHYFTNAEEMILEIKNARIIRNKFKKPETLKCRVDNNGFVSIEDDTEKDIVRVEFFKKHLMNWKKYIDNLTELEINRREIIKWIDRLDCTLNFRPNRFNKNHEPLKLNHPYAIGFNIDSKSPMLHIEFTIFSNEGIGVTMIGKIFSSVDEKGIQIPLTELTLVRLNNSFVSFVREYLELNIANQL